MGFLDHSTNNIIVDAVLTDVGRRKLASATTAENFVASYAFADDEIDYTMIKKYGTIVGKEKIEKNTPIFEASTSAELGVKYFLKTSSNPVVAQAVLEIDTTQTLLNNTNKSTTLNIKLNDTEGLVMGLTYTINYDSRYLSPRGVTNQLRESGSAHRYFFTVEAAQAEDKTVVFERGSRGQSILEARSQEAEVTQIRVKSTDGHNQALSVEVRYN